MVVENPKFKKLSKVVALYSVFVLFHIVISLLFNDLRYNPIFYASSRFFILFISLAIYIQLAKELGNIYFRFLFVACTILLVFGVVALWDSTINVANSTFRGFQYICIGYVLENLCFSLAFIYRIISVYNQNKAKEISYERQLATMEVEIQTQTMQHIGREIHDNVGQKLTLASLYTQQLVFENKALNISDKINGISNIINQSLSELRQLSKSLTDNVIENNSIIVLLEKEFEKIKGLKKYETKLIINVKELKLPYDTKSVLLRVVQEFTQNSIKHAQCKTIATSLGVNNNKLKFIVADDGKGFEISKNSNKGMGLINMKNRIELIGGSYFMQSAKGVGTMLTIEISL